MHNKEWRNKLKKIFSSVLREKLEKTGITQRELSIRTGISYGTINNYIHAKTIPSAYNVYLISEALSCSQNDFYEPAMNEVYCE